MLAPRNPLTSNPLIAFAGIACVAMLIASIALLIRVSNSVDRAPTPDRIAAARDPQGPAAPPSSPAGPAITPVNTVRPATAAPGNRFTLRLGQGFRFKDGVVVTQDDQPDIVFKYVAPQVGG